MWSLSNIYREVYEVYGQQTHTVHSSCLEMVENEEQLGRLSDVHMPDTIAGVWALLEDDHWLIIHQIEF